MEATWHTGHYWMDSAVTDCRRYGVYDGYVRWLVYAVLCFLPNQVEKVRSQAARQRVATAPEEETVFLKPV